MSCIMRLGGGLCARRSAACQPRVSARERGAGCGHSSQRRLPSLPIGRQKEEAEEKSQLWRGEMKRRKGNGPNGAKKRVPLQTQELWHRMARTQVVRHPPAVGLMQPSIWPRPRPGPSHLLGDPPGSTLTHAPRNRKPA